MFLGNPESFPIPRKLGSHHVLIFRRSAQHSLDATQRLSFLLGHCPHWAYCPCWAYLVSNCQSGISRATPPS
jgi:hypothetical protein